MAHRVYLGIDLGAESGRVIAGLWNGKSLRLEELHRFPNGPVPLAGTLRWDVLRLLAEIQNGLALAGKKYGRNIVSVGADTWGVDFALLSKNGELLGQPYHYRDARTNGMMEKAFKKVPRSEIFAQTGLQFMQLNTLYQLLALKEAHPDVLEAADCLLMMSDFVHWALCGSRAVEFTIGSTSQCLNPVTRNWASGLLKKFGLPARIFLFLFSYDLNSTQERKNPRAAIAAFRKAFPLGGPFGLVVKTHNPDRNSSAFAELKAELEGLPNTFLICETLSRTAVYELEQACDCFVSLHRAEGFGLAVAEAMFLGKPVIATDWSGTAEFVNVTNGCPVSYRLLTLDRNYGPYARGQTWADPDIDQAAHWMRSLADDSSFRESLGRRAAADIRRNFAPKTIGRRYQRRLESFSLW